MNTLKKNSWRILFGLYVFIYLPWFFYLEKTITLESPGIHIINFQLDNAVPFCEYFIIPYILWFFYIAASCVYMVIKSSNSEFLRFALSLIVGMSLALTICMLYPNGITLRPDSIPDNFFGRIVAGLYATDTSTNVFPSIHVYNSLAVHIALNKCEALKKHYVIRYSSLILCILICLSTVFLKQHSIIDAVGGIALMLVMYLLVYVVDYRKLFIKKQQS
ncbi:MAG: phosphatase PAP2 family protein [Eubacteriales bacterium]|nr:phosphatase PAP2 family protein [Eubacteriales bacterium]